MERDIVDEGDELNLDELLVKSSDDADDKPQISGVIELARQGRELIAAIILLGLAALIALVWRQAAGVWIAAFLSIFVTFGVGRKIWREGIRALRQRAYSPDYFILFITIVLVILGVAGLLSGHFRVRYLFDSGLAIAAVLGGCYGRAFLERRMGMPLERLAEACVGRALVQRAGRVEEVNSDVLRHGDILIGEAGSAVVADGVVLRGAGEVSEVLFHSQRVVVAKTPGDLVLAGSKVQSGRLEFQIIKIGRETLVGQMARLARSARQNIGTWQIWAHRHNLAAILLTSIIAATALIISLARHQGAAESLDWSLVILAASAPGLWLAGVKGAVLALVNRALTAGLVIRDPAVMAKVSRLGAVIFDKSETISEGKPKVVQIIPVSKGVSVDWVLKTAAALETCSDHPISEGILRKWQRQIREASAAEVVLGLGVRGIVEGKRMILGNIAFMHQYNISIGQATTERIRQLEAAGKTLLFLARENTHLDGIVVLEDAVRPNIADAIGQLKKKGYKTVLATGDNTSAAQIVGGAIGADETVGGALPAAKADAVERWRERSGMVLAFGSGESDQAMVARADIGVSNCTGLDIMSRRGQAILVNGDAGDILPLIKLSRAATWIGSQNLIWGYLFNAAFMALALGRVVSLEAAIVASAASPLVPLLNAWRLKTK